MLFIQLCRRIIVAHFFGFVKMIFEKKFFPECPLEQSMKSRDFMPMVLRVMAVSNLTRMLGRALDTHLVWCYNISWNFIERGEVNA